MEDKYCDCQPLDQGQFIGAMYGLIKSKKPKSKEKGCLVCGKPKDRNADAPRSTEDACES